MTFTMTTSSTVGWIPHVIFVAMTSRVVVGGHQENAFVDFQSGLEMRAPACSPLCPLTLSMVYKSKSSTSGSGDVRERKLVERFDVLAGVLAGYKCPSPDCYCGERDELGASEVACNCMLKDAEAYRDSERRNSDPDCRSMSSTLDSSQSRLHVCVMETHKKNRVG